MTAKGTEFRGTHGTPRELPNLPDGPTVEGLQAGDHAYCTSDQQLYRCEDATPGGASWKPVAQGPFRSVHALRRATRQPI
jgi:hypothetical protein